MKMKLFAGLVCTIFCLAAPSLVMADLGEPDTLFFIPSALEAGANDTILTIEVWCFNDADILSGISMGFQWETDNLELIGAVPESAATAAWNQFFFVEGPSQSDYTIANQNKRALFAGFGIFTPNLQATPDPKLLATYTFRVSNWDVASTAIFDSTHWDDGTEMFYTTDQFENYVPVWQWGTDKLVIKDVNAVECDPPIITCPTSVPDVELCGPDQVCIDLPIAGADNVTVDGATWSNGQLCFQADTSGTYDFHVEATVDCGEMSSCDFSVNVTIGSAPVIECPTVAFNETLCGPGQVCVPLSITNATNVNAEPATWSNGQLCFQADTAGTYQIQVNATNNEACGEDNCTVTVIVTMQDSPSISCPEPTQELLCAPGQFCMALDIAMADDVTVEGATWVDGVLCFDADTSGSYSFAVIASNQCGEVSCTVNIDIVIEGTPEIACPTAPVTQFLCEPGQVCLALPITGATDVTTNIGTWTDGQLCFQADAAGSYDIQVEATNSCGFRSCDFTVNVEIGAAPAITCPGAPVEVFIQYAEQVCVDLPVSGAANIDVDNGGSWAAGQLCFQADTSGSYAFHIVASSDCGEDTCDLVVAVDITPPLCRYSTLRHRPVLYGFRG